MLEPSDAVFGIFVLASWPLVAQDHRDLGVEWWWLAVFSAIVLSAAAIVTPREASERAWQGVAVLLIGTVLLVIVRDGLGEGDVVFAVALAPQFSGVSLLLALAWSCVVGIVGWGTAVMRRPEAADEPLPLIPALVTGACIEYALNRMVAW